MIDKLLQSYINSPDAAATVKEQTGRATEVGGGLEGQKEKYGLRMKKGGQVKKMQKGGVTFDFDAANQKAMGEIRGNMMKSMSKNMNMADFMNIMKNPGMFGKTAERYQVKQRGIPGFQAYKKGGMACKGQGLARKKKFKVY